MDMDIKFIQLSCCCDKWKLSSFNALVTIQSTLKNCVAFCFLLKAALELAPKTG